MAERILVCWVGKTDIRCSKGDEDGLGPLAQGMIDRTFDRAMLVSDEPESALQKYSGWLKKQSSTPFRVKRVELPNGPMDFSTVYQISRDTVLESLRSKGDPSAAEQPELTFNISPGTPVMASAWIILSKTRFPATIIGADKKKGIYDVAVPFEMDAHFIGDLLQGPDAALRSQSEAKAPENPELQEIIGRSKPMVKVKDQALKVAPRSAPVLILGESGTGKELFARAIHKASGRKGKFIPVNCGAISPSLFESELFGHRKGSFTGADKDRLGHFREANDGTIFLDELGELPMDAQVKLLRALQEEEVVPVGASTPTKINARVIAATNRDLARRVVEGKFREDLFFRLAVAVLDLPPLREREGDLRELVDFLLSQVNEKSRNEPGYKSKKLSTGARSLIAAHPWPGNVRELYNTLMRAAIWSDGETITKEEMRDSLITMPTRPSLGVMDHALGGDFSLEELLDEVSRHYIQRALEASGGVKTRAAESVGFKSHQRLTDWMVRLGMEDA